MCTIIYVKKAESTNSLMSAKAANYLHGTCLVTLEQTAGRGQKGNKWESEPGKNLTFSLLLRPRQIIASHQFELSQVVALAITKVLRSELGTDDVCIKWPNDIYYRDKKLCGILIENSLMGPRIEHTIVGVGLNVNQVGFVSDAPNPISMAEIAGKNFDLEILLEKIVNRIINDFDDYEDDRNSSTLAARYRFMLWRGDGFWPYHDNIANRDFEARIAAIDPSGHITLATHAGTFHKYAFKEVSSII